MPSRIYLLALALSATTPAALWADSLWDRRDPNTANLFHDYRARKVGDVLTIAIDETTGSDAQEKREMEKKTKAGLGVGGEASTSALGQVLRSFGYDATANTNSQRAFDGKANSTINRNFTDRLTVTVVAIHPNGNLVVEGFRQRLISRELRTLRVVGIVRPADIGPFNTIQSQYIADLNISYMGRGPESSYTNQGWGGRIFNRLWPY